ncbi:MAG: hypothetical protein MJB57_00240 [Gemmatimonadetes bacterium]|nr:hypothetical protein [Gemmatimonadota bacterium]
MPSFTRSRAREGPLGRRGVAIVGSGSLPSRAIGLGFLGSWEFRHVDV